jgi:hypothetical protein
MNSDAVSTCIPAHCPHQLRRGVHIGAAPTVKKQEGNFYISFISERDLGVGGFSPAGISRLKSLLQIDGLLPFKLIVNLYGFRS